MNGIGAPASAAVERPRHTPLLIRILMIGDSSVGKTSLVLRYDNRGFNRQFTTTIGVDYSDRLLELDGRQVKLQVTLPDNLMYCCNLFCARLELALDHFPASSVKVYRPGGSSCDLVTSFYPSHGSSTDSSIGRKHVLVESCSSASLFICPEGFLIFFAKQRVAFLTF